MDVSAHLKPFLSTPTEVWCTFDSVLSNSGRNGKVFFVKVPGVSKKIVAKISRSIDFSIRHEHAVMTALSTLKTDHFPQPYALTKCRVSSAYRHAMNPLDTSKDKYPITIDMLLMEHVTSVTSLEKFAKTKPSSVELFSLAKQVMLAICHAQDQLKFTHYDLHPANVLVKECEEKTLTYTIRDKVYSVKTHGYKAVIIDFGLSYVNTLKHQYCALFHTEIGVMSDRHTPFSDLKLFLVSLNTDAQNPKLDKFVNKVFTKLRIDWETGWDIRDDGNALDHVYNHVYDRHIATSRIFSEYGYMCFALLQSLIKHPMSSAPGVKKSYDVLEREFSVIENEIGSAFYNIYIFAAMVDAARDVYDMYLNDNLREEAVRMFKRRTMNSVDSIASFCTLKDVKWERILCGMYAFAAYMSGEIATYLQLQTPKYKLPVKTDMELVNLFSSEFTV